MPDKKLFVIGAGEEYDAICKIAKSNITVMGYQDNEILINNMRKARAFIYAAVEDFGIVPIEALSCGTPVIALNEGGTAETVQDGINGIHFSFQTKEAIIQAVGRFEMQTFDHKSISEDTKKYSEVRFRNEIKGFIEGYDTISRL